MLDKLKNIEKRYEEIGLRLSQPEAYADMTACARLQKERSQLEPLVETFRAYETCLRDLEGAKALLSDPECRELAQEELEENKRKKEQLEPDLKILLLSKDPNDERNVVVEIRAGVGGEESALFAGDLYRMYSMYAAARGWKTEIANLSETELGGIREISFVIEGEGAYSRLKFESGVHRVQRVPETEAGGRIHTSTATVAVLPEVDPVEFHLDLKDVQIDTFRSSGAAHLLALSGLHVGILFMILNRITALFSLTLAARRMRVLVVVGCTAAFLAITGFIPSLARAIIMAAICSIAKVWGYRIARAETLVITAFLLICYNPQVVASIGFQLSFAAMAGIMLIMPTLSESLKRVMERWRGRGMASRTICWCAERIAAPLLLTISCQITTLPLCLYYFQSFSNYYLITNLIAIPVVAITLYMLTAALAIDALALIIQSDLLTSLSVFVWESIRYILLLLESTLKEFR